MWLYPTNITYFRRYTPFGAYPMAEHGVWRLGMRFLRLGIGVWRLGVGIWRLESGFGGSESGFGGSESGFGGSESGFGNPQYITYQRLTTYACSPFAAGILPNPLNPKALPATLFPAPPQAKIQKPSIYFAISENSNTFALPIGRPILPPARMAESVDALVSNTSGAIRAGSIPAPGTQQNASA